MTQKAMKIKSKKHKTHFLVQGYRDIYFRACDSFYFWRGKKPKILLKDVNCLNCRKTNYFKLQLFKEWKNHLIEKAKMLNESSQ